MVREGLWEKFETMFRNFGWDVVIVKYGRLMDKAFAEPGGEELRRWIDTCPHQRYAALCFQGGPAFRKRLMDEIGDGCRKLVGLDTIYPGSLPDRYNRLPLVFFSR